MPQTLLPTNNFGPSGFGAPLNLEPPQQTIAELQRWESVLRAREFDAHVMYSDSPYVTIFDRNGRGARIWVQPDGQITHFADGIGAATAHVTGHVCQPGYSPTADEVVSEVSRILNHGGQPRPLEFFDDAG